MSFLRPLSFGIAALLFMTGPALADWKLDGETSSLSFASVKSGNIAEVHHFTEIQGSVNDQGAAELRIKLASVETWADIRNERMRDFLFEITKYPEAKVTIQFDDATQQSLKSMKSGEVTTVIAPINIGIHGVEQNLDVELVVARVGEKRVLVTPKEVLVLDAAKFNMTAGIAKMMELAELPSISTAVPVTFSLVFDDK